MRSLPLLARGRAVCELVNRRNNSEASCRWNPRFYPSCGSIALNDASLNHRGNGIRGGGLDVPGLRSDRDAPGRRNRIRERDGGDMRRRRGKHRLDTAAQRQIGMTDDTGGDPSLAAVTATDSAEFAMARPGTPIVRSSIRAVRHGPGCSATMRCAPMSRPVSRHSGRDVQCLKATFRLTRKASATRSTGTPANSLREARAARKGLISSPELPHAFIGLMGLADGRCWLLVGEPLAYASKPHVGGYADARKTVGMTERLPGNTIGGETP